MNENEEPQTQVTDEKFKDGILHRLNELRKANIRCDTTLRVEGQMFPAHSHVLYAAPDYFSTVARRDKTLPRFQKHVPESKTRPRIQKHVPESKTLPRIQKHVPESETLPRIQNRTK